jgi:hypothetical protein
MIDAAPPAGIERLQQRSLIVGIVGLVICLVGLFLNPNQFFHSYLLGYMFWTGIGLGCLGVLMLQHLTGGGWGLVIRRLLEAGTRTLPLMAIMFIPIVIDLFWQHNLYIWSNKAAVAADPLLQHKEPYLNIPFFLVRTVFYFAIWLGFTMVLNKWSLEQDKADPVKAAAFSTNFQKISGIGLLIFALTMTFAAFDWLMSLDPHWFSSIFGLLIMEGCVLSAFACIIITAALLVETKPLQGVIQPHHFHDLGKLMLAFVMLWAYFSLSQYLIIWSANLPEEIPWFLQRQYSGWRYVGIALIVLHFALPFVLLLSRGLKRNYKRLIYVAALILFMRIVDLFWIIAPESHGIPKHYTHFEPHSFHIHWLDFAAPIGIGGIWLWAYLTQLKARPLLPVHDPSLEEVLHHVGH